MSTITIYFATNTYGINGLNKAEAADVLKALAETKGIYKLPMKADDGTEVLINCDQIQYVQCK